jgi:hypothetical protein
MINLEQFPLNELNSIIEASKQKFESEKPNIMVIGSKQSGKSTLINYLLGTGYEQTEKQHKNENEFIPKLILDKNTTEYAPRESTSHCTLYNGNAFNYIDTPGNSTKNDSSEELQRSSSLSAIFEKAQKISAVIVTINWSDWNDIEGALAVDLLIKSLNSIDSCIFIFTNTPNSLKKDKVISRLKGLLEKVDLLPKEFDSERVIIVSGSDYNLNTEKLLSDYNKDYRPLRTIITSQVDKLAPITKTPFKFKNVKSKDEVKERIKTFAMESIEVINKISKASLQLAKKKLYSNSGYKEEIEEIKSVPSDLDNFENLSQDYTSLKNSGYIDKLYEVVKSDDSFNSNEVKSFVTLYEQIKNKEVNFFHEVIHLEDYENYKKELENKMKKISADGEVLVVPENEISIELEEYRKNAPDYLKKDYFKFIYLNIDLIEKMPTVLFEYTPEKEIYKYKETNDECSKENIDIFLYNLSGKLGEIENAIRKSNKELKQFESLFTFYKQKIEAMTKTPDVNLASQLVDVIKRFKSQLKSSLERIGEGNLLAINYGDLIPISNQFNKAFSTHEKLLQEQINLNSTINKIDSDEEAEEKINPEEVSDTKASEDNGVDVYKDKEEKTIGDAHLTAALEIDATEEKIKTQNVKENDLQSDNNESDTKALEDSEIKNEEEIKIEDANPQQSNAQGNGNTSNDLKGQENLSENNQDLNSTINKIDSDEEAEEKINPEEVSDTKASEDNGVNVYKDKEEKTIGDAYLPRALEIYNTTEEKIKTQNVEEYDLQSDNHESDTKALEDNEIKNEEEIKIEDANPQQSNAQGNDNTSNDLKGQENLSENNQDLNSTINKIDSDEGAEEKIKPEEVSDTKVSEDNGVDVYKDKEEKTIGDAHLTTALEIDNITEEKIKTQNVKENDLQSDNHESDTEALEDKEIKNEEEIKIEDANSQQSNVQGNDNTPNDLKGQEKQSENNQEAFLKLKSQLIKSIKAMHDYGASLKQRGHSKGQIAMVLADKLKLKVDMLCNFEKKPSEDDVKDFVNLLTSKNEEMAHYRASWSTIAINIVISLILVVGPILILGKLIHSKMTQSRFLFFAQKEKTTSEEKIEDIKQIVDKLPFER